MTHQESPGTTAISQICPEDALRINPRYPLWKGVIPFPPDSLMFSVGSQTIENFLVVGQAWAQVVSKFTRPECSVLDLGCGCGKTARMLVTNRHITTYTGFDVVKEGIDWCTTYLAPNWPGASRFVHYDLYSKEYNPQGKILATELKFPCEDNTVDVAFAASLFTHLLYDDACHYLGETFRVLKPGGKAAFSIHNQPQPGLNFSGTEARIDIASSHFVWMAEQARLRVHEHFPDVCGQEVFVFTK